jgi:hypothetical protein
VNLGIFASGVFTRLAGKRQSNIEISTPPRVAEASLSSPRFPSKLIHNLELRSDDGDEDHLADAIAGVDRERLLTAVPYADTDFAVVVRVDQPHQVAENDAVPDTEPGAGNHNGRHILVTEADRNPTAD